MTKKRKHHDPEEGDATWESVDPFGGKRPARLRPNWRDLFHLIAVIGGALLYIRYVLA